MILRTAKSFMMTIRLDKGGLMTRTIIIGLLLVFGAIAVTICYAALAMSAKDRDKWFEGD